MTKQCFMFFLLNLLFIANANSNFQYTQCSPEQLSPFPGFSLTDSSSSRGGNRLTEKVDSFDLKPANQKLVLALTIVKPLTNPLLVKEANLRKNKIPIQIISPPKIEDIDQLSLNSKIKKWLGLTARKSKISPDKLANVGEIGLVDSTTLLPADDFNFYINENQLAPILPKPTIKFLEGKVVRLAKKDGQFRFFKCCDPNNSLDCIRNDIFEVVSPNQDSESKPIELSFSVDICDNFFSTLVPIKKEHSSALLKIKEILDKQKLKMSFNDKCNNQIEIMDSRGFIKIPTCHENFEKDDEIGDIVKNAFGGSAHYRPDDPFSNDAFMNPTSACALLQFLDAWDKICPPLNSQTQGCTVKWGDAYHHKNWGVHNDHDDGMCIDFRPLLKEDFKGGVDYKNPLYSRDKTKVFLNLLSQFGATGNPSGSFKYPLFNDPRIRENINHLSGHNSHIHACFSPTSPAVQNICENGIDIEKLPDFSKWKNTLEQTGK